MKRVLWVKSRTGIVVHFAYQIPQSQNPPREKVLAVSSILRLQDEEDFDRKMALLTYILNLYCCFLYCKDSSVLESAYTCRHFAWTANSANCPIFESSFRKEDIKKVVTADIAPLIHTTDEIDAIASGGMLDSIVNEATYQDSLDQFVGLFSRERVRNIRERVGRAKSRELDFIFFT